ncbi:Uu.00g105660.m01.CDS01 [Anthostomella pinea]|uniref:Triosephosphate isomerase n=1 Tax=Anthostomella pinea TaxID=933095 RepID=A0AAI8VF05_9PEZI|nr:Uu.00g105660.m01.CDS01 [Anthostomella pinea]
MASPPRRRLVGVSTKMFFSAARTRTYINDLLHILSNPPSPDLLQEIDIFLIPDHLTLATSITQLRTSPVPILPGAQDTHHADSGAYTGAVSPAVLAELGCRIVELGHAERRRLFGETDETTALKAAAVARNGMTPLVCIGERTRGEIGVAVDECVVQVEAVVAAVPADSELILAYEPVWAIGAAQPAGAEHVVGVARAIRGLACVQGRKGTTRILYGGSAGPGLFENLKEGVDGLFLGRFAHVPEQFYKTIVEIAAA